MAWLPDGGKISKISLFFLAQLTNVTDRRTLHDSKDRAYASHRAVINKRLPILVRITTNGHKASRGLSATVELLVSINAPIS